MRENEKLFELKKTFGLGVLLKLTKKNATGIEISTIGNKFTSNIPLNELSSVVDSIMEIHNIRLKIK